jgi:hypothetical protein
MKKILVTILALVYLSVSSGATVHVHYCMGKLMNWSLSDKKDGKCGTCGMQKSVHKGCCQDEQKQLKIEKDQKVSETAFQFHTISSVAVAHSYLSLPSIYFLSRISDIPVAHAPPQPGAVPIFVLNRNFRI